MHPTSQAHVRPTAQWRVVRADVGRVQTSPDTLMKLILNASDIPLGSTVTKITGEKEYILRDELKVYGENSTEPRSLKASKGTVFMVSDHGDANAVSGDTKLAWIVDKEELLSWLRQHEHRES